MEARKWKEHRNLLPSTGKGYTNPDNDQRGSWRSIPFSAQGYRPNQMYKIETPAGGLVDPPKGRCWAATEPVYLKYKADDRIYFPNKGKGRPRVKQFAGEEKGLVPMTLWLASDVGNTEQSKKEILDLFQEESPFATPKPERLLQHIITIATNPGDLVLDSFLGSGTTAAVAHKMGRRYIGVEMGDHAVTHCVPRLQKVIEGEQGGISKDVQWKGGGGFRFMRLGPPIFDNTGVLNSDIRFPNLAAHIWFSETHTGWRGKADSPLLGIHKGIAYYLLYNGILGNRRPGGGNVLNTSTFKKLPAHDGPKVIYGEWSQWREDRLRRERITFKMIPYEIKVR
jgi:adenine-specific DNA-methyltransferase